MKINLLRGSNEFISGYTNIDPYGNDDNIVIGEIENLDYVADDAQCIEIRAIDIIDYIEPSKIDKVLYHWMTKLRIGGTITIGGTDLSLVCNAFLDGSINADVATSLLYGQRFSSYQYKKNITTLENLCDFFESAGYKILLKRYDFSTMNYLIKAERQ